MVKSQFESITADSSIAENNSEIGGRVLGTVSPKTLSTHQGFGLGHSENLCPTSPQLIKAIVLRRLLYSSSVSFDLAVFQDSNGFSVKNTLRLEPLSMPADLVKPLEL